MKENGGEENVPPLEEIDKSRVLSPMPLRYMAPIFPSSSNISSLPTHQVPFPFDSVSPAGKFPPGFAPPGEHNQHTPFGVPNHNAAFGFDMPISDAVPITSFRTPPATKYSGAENGGAGSSRRSKGRVAEEGNGVTTKGRSQKRTRGQDINSASREIDVDALVNEILACSNLTEFDTVRKADGDKDSVGYILMIYDLLRRKITQTEDVKASAGLVRQPALKAGKVLMNKGIRTNVRKRIGVVPGVEVGDIFFFRMELCLVGLHAQCMGGIDYMKLTQEEEPVAVSIVSSGGYEDIAEDGNALVYTGQGGNLNYKDKEVSDQKLERGNLALEKSLHRANEVRVIRGLKDAANPTGKVYIYDGLYKIHESWVEKGKLGCNIFKYKLIRLPCQPEAFMLWRSIQEWKEGISSRAGVILPDLTSGAENLPVALVNNVDDEKGPAYFTYVPSLKYSKQVTSQEPSISCDCTGGCLPDITCVCIQKNGGYLSYSTNGILVSQKTLVHECGLSCKCPPTCRNRVSQGGLRVRLEVFKTKDKGWGLRSWDPIRAGAFICVYAGEVIDKSKVAELEAENDDDYIFYVSPTYQPPHYLNGNGSDAPKVPFPLTINSKDVGNVARFMNHSCSPNVCFQPVLLDKSNGCKLHIAFHAIRNIPPMTELTYDYGIVQTDKTDQKKKKCSCGSLKCRGYF